MSAGDQHATAHATAHDPELVYRVSALEKSMEALVANQAKLTEDAHQIAIGVAKLLEDRAALGRCFKAVEAVEERQREIEREMEESKRKRIEDENARLLQELDAQRRTREQRVTEVVKIVLVVAVSLIAAHFGVKLIG